MQRTLEDLHVGDEVPPVDFPISIYRLVVAAGGNRDFNSIHHNSSYARASGAPDMYASTFVIMGAWERVIRDFIGTAGTILAIRDFRMRAFNVVGSVMSVGGQVAAIRDDGTVVLELTSRVGDDITVGPGRVDVTLPRK